MATKWRMLGGKVFKLDQEFRSRDEALSRAEELRKENLVHLFHTTDGRWLVYWRSRDPKVECHLSNYWIN